MGSNSTPEHGSDSPSYGIQSSGGEVIGGGIGVGGMGPSGLFVDYNNQSKHKKSKKKKKKKDREKRHKHHKEKRRNRDDSSQEDLSIGEDTLFPDNIMRYAEMTTASSLASVPVSRPMIPMREPSPLPTPADAEIKTEADEVKTPVKEEPTDASEPLVHTPSNNVLTSSKVMDASKSSASSNESGREPRTCVLKLKQSKSPLSKLLDHMLKSLEKRDPHQFFAWPVTDDIAPGYSSIITKPMDFSTIRQKIDDNLYVTLNEFSDDFKLMCENAIRYNHVETVYHKAAKRLLHVGARLLLPDHLLRALRPLMAYMRELSPKELGFELPPSGSSASMAHLMEGQDTTNLLDSGDETGGFSMEDGGLSLYNEEDEKKKAIRLENDPKGHFEPYVDDLTAEEILAQVQGAAILAKNRLAAKRKPHKMGFLRQNKDGTTSMKILVGAPNDTPERVISLGAFTGKLQQGTGQLQTFREDRRNVAKIVKPLNYGAFSSFAPIYDSRFSNLTKEETELVLNTYGDEASVQYADSILEFTQNSHYATGLANSLLDCLTGGEHRKTMATLVESHRQRNEQLEVENMFPDAAVDEDPRRYDNIKIDFDDLKSLSNLGVDIGFVEKMENDLKLIEIQKKLQSQLDVNSTLIERLHQVQYERLSQPLPPHLAHISKPDLNEIQLAAQLTSNLTEMAKQLTPGAIVPPHSLRKAMGISTVGLEPYSAHQMTMNEAQAILNHNLVIAAQNRAGS